MKNEKTSRSRMAKISIFGPRDKLPQKETIEYIVRTISKEIGIFEIATGGIVGFPTEVLKSLKNNYSIQKNKAYTPCSDESEWNYYQEKGLVPDRSLFNEVIWTPMEIGELKEKALYRISYLVSGSKANLAFLDGPGNTNLEIMSSLSLGIPTLCLVNNLGEAERWEGIYEKLSREGNNLKFYSDSQELMYQFVRRLKC